MAEKQVSGTVSSGRRAMLHYAFDSPECPANPINTNTNRIKQK